MQQPLKNHDLPLPDKKEFLSLLQRFEKDEFKSQAIWERVNRLVEILMKHKLTQRNRLSILAFYALCESHINAIQAELQIITEIMKKRKDGVQK